jgi:hypothetical protein
VDLRGGCFVAAGGGGVDSDVESDVATDRSNVSDACDVAFRQLRFA